MIVQAIWIRFVPRWVRPGSLGYHTSRFVYVPDLLGDRILVHCLDWIQNIPATEVALPAGCGAGLRS